MQYNGILKRKQNRLKINKKEPGVVFTPRPKKFNNLLKQSFVRCSVFGLDIITSSAEFHFFH